MAELTPQEILLVNQLRLRLDGSLCDETLRSNGFLIRWIRARDGNLDAAEKMLQENIRWRVEHNLSSVLEQRFAPILHQLMPFHMKGKDKEGRVVVEVHYGKWDIRKVVSTFGEEEFFQYTNQMFELILHAISKCGQGLKTSQALFLIDAAGFSYSQLVHLKSLQSVLKTVGKYEAHYPEIMWRAVVINAPSVYFMLYAMIKPLLAVNTNAKISIYKDNRSMWEPVLDAMVEKNQVGVVFGGTADR